MGRYFLIQISFARLLRNNRTCNYFHAVYAPINVNSVEGGGGVIEEVGGGFYHVSLPVVGY